MQQLRLFFAMALLYNAIVASCWIYFTIKHDARNQKYIDSGLFTYKSVPVIFEPPCIFRVYHISLYKLNLTYLCIIITNYYYYMYFIVVTHSVLCLLTTSISTLVDLLNTK